jgi:hypothetical protein
MDSPPESAKYRACGVICVTRGTGEKHFPAVRAQDAAKVRAPERKSLSQAAG